jgi:hypothetical protein
MTCPHDNQEYAHADGTGKCLDCGEDLLPIVVPIGSPSGTLLAHTGSGTNWVLAHEWPRVAKAMASSTMAASKDGMGVLRRSFACKYLEIRMDMRGGNFIILDNHADRVDGDDDVLRALGIQ